MVSRGNALRGLITPHVIRLSSQQVAVKQKVELSVSVKNAVPPIPAVKTKRIKVTEPFLFRLHNIYFKVLFGT